MKPSLRLCFPGLLLVLLLPACKGCLRTDEPPSSTDGGDAGNPSGTDGGTGHDGGTGRDGGSTTKPIVDELSPSAGPYRTEVVIRGVNLRGSGSGASLDLGQVSLKPDSSEVLEWTDTLIRFRYPFPASGSMTLKTSKGAVYAGSFSPAYIARGLPDAGAPRKYDLVDVWYKTDGGMGAIFHHSGGVEVVRWEGDTPTREMLENGELGLSRVSLTPGRSARYIGAALRPLPDGGENIYTLRWSDAGEPLFEPLGVETGNNVSVISAGEDDGGQFVWYYQLDAGFVRLREGRLLWLPDRGPIPAPDYFWPTASQAKQVDGTLEVVWGKPAGGCWFFFCDFYDYAYYSRLLPDASTFTPSESPHDDIDDDMISIRLSTHPDGRRRMHACGYNDNIFYSEYDCATYVRGEDGGWRYPPSGLGEGEAVQAAFAPAGGVLAECRDDGQYTHDVIQGSPRVMTPDGGQLGVWPCGEVYAVETDPQGVPQVLLSYKKTLYAPLRAPCPDVPCEPGQVCEGGRCVCSPGSCASGCCFGRNCYPASLQACGVAGGMCSYCAPELADQCSANGQCVCGESAACTPGQRCEGGQCVCDNQSCPNGCCDSARQCHDRSLGYCGVDGGPCETCSDVAANHCSASGQCRCYDQPPCDAGLECSFGGCECTGRSCPKGCCQDNTCMTIEFPRCGIPGQGACTLCSPYNSDHCTPEGKCGCGRLPACAYPLRCVDGLCMP